ncbi:MAG: hypothetical protein NXI13_02490 [Proteobacteria bacterium]|nr:hypothetical protein [Pseudomonadota bacterium]
MTDLNSRQSDTLEKILNNMNLLRNNFRQAEREAAGLTRQFDKLDLGLKAGAGSGTGLFEALGSGVKDMQEELASLTGIGERTAASLRSAFGGAFQKLMLKGQDFKSVLASLETDLLSLGGQAFGGGLASAGQGLLSQIFPGFSNGGSFTVGGAAGVDRNLVGLRLTRGEKVTVETPAQARQSPQQASPAANVTLAFNITTPDADSFRRSQSQIQGEALRQAQRQLQRNG